MKRIRNTVVAGTFYPGNKEDLKNMIEGFLDNARVPVNSAKNILGIISPHAGYMFSGQAAAYCFQAIKDKDFSYAVIIAPSHQFANFAYSVGDFDAYETPLGNVEVDQPLVKELLSDPKFTFHAQAHLMEHSLEVQLPFLRTIKPEAKIIPIILGNQSLSNSRNLANTLAAKFSDKLDKTLFIISTDLSHYYDSGKAQKIDNLTTDVIEAMDEEQLWNLIKINKCEACGFGGVMTLISLGRILGYNRAKTLIYTHSGETGGDNSQVVGYLSSMIYK